MFLLHYGVKGQKWGVRRYQNYDGTFTPLGQKRRKHYKSTVFRKALAPELRSNVSLLKSRERSAEVRAAKSKNSFENKLRTTGKIDRKALAKAEQHNTDYAIIKLRNKKLRNYAKTVSTGKLFMQSLLLGPTAIRYRDSKARGLNSTQAFLESRSAVASELASRSYYGIAATEQGLAGRNYVLRTLYDW